MDFSLVGKSKKWLAILGTLIIVNIVGLILGIVFLSHSWWQLIIVFIVIVIDCLGYHYGFKNLKTAYQAAGGQVSKFSRKAIIILAVLTVINLFALGLLIYVGIASWAELIVLVIVAGIDFGAYYFISKNLNPVTSTSLV